MALAADPAHPPVYRVPMRSRRPGVPEGAGVERALVAGVCGLGGLVELGAASGVAAEPAGEPGGRDRSVAEPAGGPSSSSAVTIAEAAAELERAAGERAARRLERFAAVPDGAFVWTRDVDGAYLLGRLDGPYRYDASAPARAADLVHVRPCRWLEVPVEPARVPAAVVAAFGRGGRNFQRIRHASAAPATAAIWTDAEGSGRVRR